MKRQILAVLMVLAMLSSLAPSAFAAPDEGNGSTASSEQEAETLKGTCGATASDAVNWALKQNPDGETYTLTISGSGVMKDYTGNIKKPNAKKEDLQPWNVYDTGVSYDHITKVVVADGITTVGAFAFNGLNCVEEYDIANTVTKLNSWALDVQAVKTFDIHDNQNFAVNADGILMSADGTTLIGYPGGKSAVDEYTIPTAVTTVAAGAFVGCDAKKIIIPKTVTSIPGWSFSEGTIEEIEFHANMDQIVSGMFSGIASLKKFTFGEDTTITTIKNSAFMGSTSLEEITFPDSLHTIENQAFGNCSSLTELTFPDHLQKIGDQAFKILNGNPGLIKVTFGKSMPDVGNGIFLNQSKLETVDMSQCETTKISSGIFNGIKSLKNVTFPAGLTEIGNYAFQNCTSLASLDFPDTLVTIGEGAFSGCSGLSHISYGSGVDTIATNAFSNCTGLKVIDLHTATHLGELWFNGLNDGDRSLNGACGGPGLHGVYYYFRTVKQANSAKGNIGWSSKGADSGNLSNYYFVLAQDEAPDVTGATTTPKKDQMTFAGWKAVTDKVVTDTPQPHTVYTATWKNRTMTGISVSTAKTYTVGDRIAPEDLTVAEVYDNGETEPIAAGGFKISAPTGILDSAGDTIVKVTYQKDGKNYTANCTIKVSKGTQAAPNEVPVLKSRDQNSIILNTVEANAHGAMAQYSKDGGKTWQDSPKFTGLTSGTTYTFAVRYAETENYQASKAGNTAEISTESSGSSRDDSSPAYTITVPGTKNGTVTVSPRSADKGDKVTVTVKPDSGYELDQITVKDASGNTLKLTDQGDGKYTFTMPASRTTVAVSFAAVSTPDNGFRDVAADAWYADAVNWAVSKGVTSGTSETTFSPDSVCTRAQVVTFLYRAAKAQGVDTTQGGMAIREYADFDSIPSYAAASMDWAVNTGILQGSNNRLMPNESCTRAQIATILYRFAKLCGMDTTQAGMAIREYADFDSIPSYAGTAMDWAVNAGVLQGSNNCLMPNESCTRAQIVTFLYRICSGK